MILRRATCSCGRLSVVCTGEPTKISLCYCLNCQRRTGSTYGIAVFYKSEDVCAQGETSRYESNADSGQAVTFQFCPTCGSTVLWEPHRKPGIVAVALGSFADPTFPAPTQAVNAEDRHSWVCDPVAELNG
jgi:hypothetical protein